MAKRKQTKTQPTELVILPPKQLRDAAGRIIEIPERKVRMSADMAVNYRSTAEFIATLKAGNGLTWAEVERFATNPPMTGARLLNIILALNDLKAEEWAKVKRAAGRAQTQAARRQAVRAATEKDGRDWREIAREIEVAGIDPRTNKPWPTRERLIEYLMPKFHKSRSAVIRALDSKRRR